MTAFEEVLKERPSGVPGLSFSVQDGSRTIVMVLGSDKSPTYWRTEISEQALVAVGRDHRAMEKLVAQPINAVHALVNDAEERGRTAGVAEGRKAAIDELRSNAALLREFKV